MRPPLDIDPHFADCVRQILREDAEQAAWEAKIDRQLEAERLTGGLLFGGWLFGAVLFGGLAWGVIALFGVPAALVIAAAWAGGFGVLREAAKRSNINFYN
jgi:hypothetical protein